VAPRDGIFGEDINRDIERAYLSDIMAVLTDTEWRRPIACLKLQIIFRKRAINYRALLRNMTYEDKASYGSSPPCIMALLTDIIVALFTDSIGMCEEGINRVIERVDLTINFFFQTDDMACHLITGATEFHCGGTAWRRARGGYKEVLFRSLLQNIVKRYSLGLFCRIYYPRARGGYEEVLCD